MRTIGIVMLVCSVVISACAVAPNVTHAADVDESVQAMRVKIPDEIRAQQIKDMKFGMFICWSFSTFYGKEWTPTQDKDATFFRATGCDTDQWCRTAKEAGMGYILFLSKHHDGFCLWDTATTDKKVTNSPLGIDVLAKLRASCDKYGIKLALYFSEGDWNWPGASDGQGGRTGGGSNPEVKKTQLKELLTQYGPIEFWWMDHAVGTGGLSHEETVQWVHTFQPNSFVGFNHGEPAGRLCLREMGRPGPIGDPDATKYNKEAEGSYQGYLAAEFTYPILPAHQGGAMWFYSLPKHDELCHAASKLYLDYVGAVKYGNIFSIDVGPNYAGQLRDIDVKTLRTVGRYIRGELAAPPPPAVSLAQGKPAQASTVWGPGYEAARACDGDFNTRWGSEPESRSGWLQIDLGKESAITKVLIDEAGYGRIQRFEVHARQDHTWKTVFTGTTCGDQKLIEFDQPVKAQVFRLSVIEASDVPTVSEFQLFDK
jgi:alpha-L-fucosidase